MADYHILGGSGDANQFTVVHHIPISVGNNRAGVAYRTALVNSGIGGKTAMVEGVGAGQISTAEKTQILSGELYEHSEQVSTNPGETATQLRDRLDARHTALRTRIRDYLQSQLSYFGFTRTVP